MEARSGVPNQLKECFIQFLLELLKLKPVFDSGKQQKKSKPSLLWTEILLCLEDKHFSLQRKARQIFQGQSLYM